MWYSKCQDNLKYTTFEFEFAVLKACYLEILNINGSPNIGKLILAVK